MPNCVVYSVGTSWATPPGSSSLLSLSAAACVSNRSALPVERGDPGAEGGDGVWRGRAPGGGDREGVVWGCPWRRPGGHGRGGYVLGACRRRAGASPDLARRDMASRFAKEGGRTQ